MSAHPLNLGDGPGLGGADDMDAARLRGALGTVEDLDDVE